MDYADDAMIVEKIEMDKIDKIFEQTCCLNVWLLTSKLTLKQSQTLPWDQI